MHPWPVRLLVHPWPVRLLVHPWPVRLLVHPWPVRAHGLVHSAWGSVCWRATGRGPGPTPHALQLDSNTWGLAPPGLNCSSTAIYSSQTASKEHLYFNTLKVVRVRHWVHGPARPAQHLTRAGPFPLSGPT